MVNAQRRRIGTGLKDHSGFEDAAVPHFNLGTSMRSRYLILNNPSLLGGVAMHTGSGHGRPQTSEGRIGLHETPNLVARHASVPTLLKADVGVRCCNGHLLKRAVACQLLYEGIEVVPAVKPAFLAIYAHAALRGRTTHCNLPPPIFQAGFAPPSISTWLRPPTQTPPWLDTSPP